MTSVIRGVANIAVLCLSLALLAGPSFAFPAPRTIPDDNPFPKQRSFIILVDKDGKILSGKKEITLEMLKTYVAERGSQFGGMSQLEITVQASRECTIEQAYRVMRALRDWGVNSVALRVERSVGPADSPKDPPAKMNDPKK